MFLIDYMFMDVVDLVVSYYMVFLEGSFIVRDRLVLVVFWDIVIR